MSEDAILKYIAAKKESDKAKQDVKEMVVIMENVARAIKDNPSKEDILNIPIIVVEGKRPSRTKVLSALHVFDADRWSDAKQIVEKLNILNDTHSNACKLWELIPPSERSNLVPPGRISPFE
ncbi:MAG: hypothetical protein FJ023_05295 [Chloroflexi bacterium]|nr:hypothetical protein [Chloroflexota bacterium]